MDPIRPTKQDAVHGPQPAPPIQPRKSSAPDPAVVSGRRIEDVPAIGDEQERIQSQAKALRDMIERWCQRVVDPYQSTSAPDASSDT